MNFLDNYRHTQAHIKASKSTAVFLEDLDDVQERETTASLEVQGLVAPGTQSSSPKGALIYDRSKTRQILGVDLRRWTLLGIIAILLILLISLVARLRGPQPHALPQVQVQGTSLADNSALPEAYALTLHFNSSHLAVGSSAGRAVQAQSVMQLRAQQTTSRVLFHSMGLTYTRISLTTSDPAQESCLCGPEDSCSARSCSETLQAARPAPPAVPAVRGGAPPPAPLPSPEVDPNLMILNLGNDVPAGSTLAINFTYVASLCDFASGGAPGLCRSLPFSLEPTTDEAPAEASQPVAEQQVLITVSTETFGARAILPCFDLPAYKANFSFALTHPVGAVALANTAAGSIRPSSLGAGLQETQFEMGPPMSTYLLAVTVGRLEGVTQQSASGMNITMWSVPGLQGQLGVALQAAVAGTDFYEDYTGIKLPLPKLDMVAIPGKRGAVEHWGLLQFDEERMLVNQASAYNRWRSADVVCHELGHQWFGNYVTCSDWSNVAVNEALASFVEYKCLAAAFPDMPAPALFSRATSPQGQAIGVHEGPREVALQVDGGSPMPSIVPNMEAPGQTPFSAKGEIIYSKGAAVLHMLEAYWNAAHDGAFRDGMRSLLQVHALGTASMEDVLAALLSVFGSNAAAPALLPGNATAWLAGNEVASILPQLSAWINEPGYPLVQVSADQPREGAPDSGLHLQQRRFLACGDEASATAEQPVWFVPLRLGRFSAGQDDAGADELGQQAGEAASNSVWLGLADSSTVLPPQAVAALETSQWVVNIGATGLFHALYPEEQQANLTAALAQLTIPTPANSSALSDTQLTAVLGGSALLGDAFALGFAGHLPPAAMLQAAAAAAAAPAAATGLGWFLLLLPVVRHLEALATLLLAAPEPCRADLRAFKMRLLANHTAAALAWEASALQGNPQDVFLYDLSKGQVMWAAAQAGDEDAAAFLCTQFEMTPGGADWQPAAAMAAVAQPPGCRLEADRASVFKDLRRRWESSPDISTAREALYALPAATQRQQLQGDRALLLTATWLHSRRGRLNRVPCFELVRTCLQSAALQAISPAALQEVLDLAFAPVNPVSRAGRRTADLVRLVAGNPQGGAGLAWQYLREQWGRLVQAQGLGSMMALLEGLPMEPTQTQLEQLEVLVGQPAPEESNILTQSRQRVLSQQRHNVRWQQDSTATVCAWLSQHLEQALP